LKQRFCARRCNPCITIVSALIVVGYGCRRESPRIHCNDAHAKRAASQ